MEEHGGCEVWHPDRGRPATPVTLRWVPAHMPERAVREGRISRQDWLGNKLADQLAGEASTDLWVPDELCRGLGTIKVMVKEV